MINAQPEEAAPVEIKLKRINTAHCGIRRVPRGGCTHATPCTPLETTLRTTPSRRSLCSRPFLTPALPSPSSRLSVAPVYEAVYNDENLFFSYFRAFLVPSRRRWPRMISSGQFSCNDTTCNDTRAETGY